MDVAIIGAGLAGLTAGRVLKGRGRSVAILDKGRGVGGRMATRRIGEARFDTGAQFFTARSGGFSEFIETTLLPAGAAELWYSRGEERYYRGDPAMTGPAKLLAAELNVSTSTKVSALEPGGSGWTVRLAAEHERLGKTIESRAILATPPVPQTLDRKSVV